MNVFPDILNGRRAPGENICVPSPFSQVSSICRLLFCSGPSVTVPEFAFDGSEGRIDQVPIKVPVPEDTWRVNVPELPNGGESTKVPTHFPAPISGNGAVGVLPQLDALNRTAMSARRASKNRLGVLA